MSGERELAGRVALVTGAGRGIGRAIADRLASDGATVVLAGRSLEALETAREEIARAGGRCAVVPVDVREQESVAELARLVREQVGPVELLVANSGIAGPTDELWRLELEDWEQTLRVNLTGVFLVCRALVPEMVARRSGSIVVIGSSTGKNPLPRRTPYAASKTALIGLVRALAWELGPYGVRVNLVSPGATDGERLDAVIARQADAGERSPEQLRAALLASSPLARLTSAQDVAAVVAFLAGEDAAAITGEDLNVSMGSVMHG